jgi:hypothetical protein
LEKTKPNCLILLLCLSPGHPYEDAVTVGNDPTTAPQVYSASSGKEQRGLRGSSTPPQFTEQVHLQAAEQSG